MARRLRVDPGTLAMWEQGERELKGDHLRRLEKIIGGSVPG
jgi:DNA-binding transcriptional regulator YiaG